MAKVRRANVVLTIKDDQVERFTDMGYDVIDELGNVIQKSVPQDISSFRKALMEAEEELKTLKEENESLKKEIASLKRKSKAVTKKADE